MNLLTYVIQLKLCLHWVNIDILKYFIRTISKKLVMSNNLH